MCSYSGRRLFLNLYRLFQFAISISTVCSFAVHNSKCCITVPLSKFHFIWYANPNTENSKMIFLNKSIGNLILQVIRNFKVEYDFEMKFKYELLRKPASPLKFRMMDREGWRRPINLSALTMSEFEHIICLERFACNAEIKSSNINHETFSEN